MTSSAPHGIPTTSYFHPTNHNSSFSLLHDDPVFHANVTSALPMESQCVLIALYTFTATLAITGNLLVLIVFSVGQRSRTDLRVFLVNLAVSDLIMAVFCMPFTFTYTMLHDWVFGPIVCKLVLYMQLVAVTASVGTSTAIAVDRYIVVAHPLRARNPRRRARCALATIWSVACSLSSVQLVIGAGPDGGSRWGFPDRMCRRLAGT